MKFSELAKVHSQELIVSPRYEAWIKANSNPHFSDEALEFMHRALIDQRTPRDRRGSVSASSLGKCQRRQQFTFMGMPEMPYSAKTSSIFVNGTFMHLRWQMAGLTEGFLAQAEVPVPKDNAYRLSGTMDGVLHEGSILELKSTNSYGFSRVLLWGPLFGHEEQGATYLLATGAEKVVFVYENKDTQEFKEIVKHRDELPLETIIMAVERLWEAIDRKVLAPPLDAVYEPKQPCSTCQFRDVCLTVETWDQAQEVADEVHQ